MATLTMKLLIDRKAQRVLFAEAGKDVVDFLFSLLALPLATAVKLVGKDAMVGSVGNLYGSIDKLDSIYVLPGAAKDALLRPPHAASASSSLLLPAPAPPKAFFNCGCLYQSLISSSFLSCYNYVTDARGTSCPVCKTAMTKQLIYAKPGGGGSEQKKDAGGAAKGFVQGIVTYTVTDDLAVAPMSAISSVTLLNTFAVKNIADLQEMTVQLGYNEGLAILKASLQSTTVLTDVFLGKA
ncbi:unnamed protein product [Urochloa decumbens]|uniref:Uncharacterized protein n=1 Tax=Urochloa decumbens TaxID=240449 RepID=A0ABC8Z3R2_9POAL